MRFTFVPALLVALTTLAVVAFATPRLRVNRKSFKPIGWAVLVLGGAVAAVVVRAVQALVLDLIVGRRIASTGEGILQSIFSFGIVGPFTVLMLAAIVWPALGATGGSQDDVDPPLAAAAAASGFVIGRLATQVLLEHIAFRSGVRSAILAVDDVALAATWGYGLALSGFDGRLGGTPFGRYALVAMALRGAIELSLRSQGPLSIPFALSAGVVLSLFAMVGILRLARHAAAPPTSLASLGQETIREIARNELRRGGVRPLWILLGAVADIGGIILGFAGAVWIGHRAGIDFGEIDRNGPGAEYAALLLAIGVIMPFPISAGVVGMASGGRRAGQRAHVLEAGIAAILALGALLFVLGVVAPVAVALGVACAPVAFALAGLGAWIAAGRRL
ncbi:MAG: hypothetical protein ACXWUG_17690 [Polyangiales bacterium]